MQVRAADDITMLTSGGRKGPMIGKRHILTLSSGLGLAVLFSTRMSLPVALVSMVEANGSSSVLATSSESYTPSSVNVSSMMAEKATSVEKFHWSSQLRGLILSSFYWGYLALQIPSGGMAQKYGGKWLVAAGIIWLSCLTFMVPWVAKFSPIALIVLLVLEGFGSSVVFPSIVAMFGRWIPTEENSSLTTLAFSGTYFGTMLGQFFSGFVCESAAMGGWPTVFYLNGAAGVVWLLFWTFFITNSPEEHPRITFDEKYYIISNVNSRQIEANRNGVPWRRILCSRDVPIYAFLSFIFGWLSYSFFICFAQYMTEILHQSTASTGWLLCLPVISEVTMANVFTRSVDLIRRRRWLPQIWARKCFTLIGFWGSGLCMFCVTLVGCDLIKTEILFVTAFGLFAANYAGYYNTPLDKYPDFSGTIFGIGNFATTSAGIIAPIVIGHVASDKSIVSWSKILYINSGLALISGFIYLVFENASRFEWTSETASEAAEREPLLTNGDGVLYS